MKKTNQGFQPRKLNLKKQTIMKLTGNINYLRYAGNTPDTRKTADPKDPKCEMPRTETCEGCFSADICKPQTIFPC